MRRLRALAGLCAAACALVVIAPAAADARSETFKLKSEPFLLSGFKTIFPKVSVPTPMRSGYITRMDAWLVDGNGRRVSIRNVMLHHIVFINGGRTDGPPKRSSCAGRAGEPFWGTGTERQPLILPFGYGYRVSKRDNWRMQAMLMSHDVRAHSVSVVYKVRMVLGAELKRVKPLWLRANGCSAHPSYDVPGDKPPGGVHSRQHLWRMPLSGRIVAASAHLHGSALGMTIKQPRCQERTLVKHDPRYGYPDDLVYQAKPVLHEPGPIATGHFLSETGIPVRKGEMLRVTGLYDGTRPHVQVMAISHVYVAVDREAPQACSPLPSDAHIHWTRQAGLLEPPVVNVPLHGLGPGGRVQEIQRPPGAQQFASDPTALVTLSGERFVPANLSVARGTQVTWRFEDPFLHNVTLASGPRHIASSNVGAGSRYSKTMTIPGTYKIFCYLHPITMTQVIGVRP